MSGQRAKKKQRRRARSAELGGAAARASRRPDAGAREASKRTIDRAPPQKPAPRFEVRDGVRRPEPVWAPFPLTELGILVGMVLFLLGYFAGSERSPVLLGTGAIVLAIVVGELCLREHFAGFRPHSLLLALLPVTVVHTFVAYAITPAWNGPVVLVAELVAAAAVGWWLQRRYTDARAQAQSRR